MLCLDRPNRSNVVMTSASPSSSSLATALSRAGREPRPPDTPRSTGGSTGPRGILANLEAAEVRGNLHVAAFQSAMLTVAPTVLDALARDHPDLDVTISQRGGGGLRGIAFP